MERFSPLRHLRLVVLAAACAVLLALSVPVQAASADSNTPSDYVARINALRASVGVQPLQVDGQLSGLAQGWAQHMASTGVLSHSSLTAGITESWSKLGENVGVGPDNPTIWNAFIHSAEHYANLVDPAFNRVGVGVAYDGNGTQWTCHKFMDLNGASAPPPAPPVTAPRVVTPVVHTAPVTHSSSSGSNASRTTTTTAGSGTGTTTTTVPPAPQAGPPPPADSQRVAAVLAALRQLST